MSKPFNGRPVRVTTIVVVGDENSEYWRDIALKDKEASFIYCSELVDDQTGVPAAAKNNLAALSEAICAGINLSTTVSVEKKEHEDDGDGEKSPGTYKSHGFQGPLPTIAPTEQPIERSVNVEAAARKTVKTIAMMLAAGDKASKIVAGLGSPSLPELIALFRALPVNFKLPIPTQSFEGDSYSRHRYIYSKVKSAQGQGLSDAAVAFKLATYVTHELLVETIAYAALGRLYKNSHTYQG